MITGEIKSQVDRIWDAFWSGGISNPMEVIEQMTYLLFIKRLDELHTAKEKKATRLKQPIENPIFRAGQEYCRWSWFKQLGDASLMYRTVAEQAFPFIKSLGGGEGSTYSSHMRDARFTIPTPALLAKVVDLLDAIPMEDRDTKGDLYEYMLGKIASAGQNGQFRTPRHIIQLMVAMMAPKPSDVICDPACGTAGFLVAASEYLLQHHQQSIYSSTESARRFNHETFHGFDFDNTMLRVGSMNMLLHGVENPAIENRDALSQGHAGVEGQFSLILANPPFAGSLDFEATAKDLLAVVKTKKTELLFLALFLRLLKPGGRAAVIVPDGVLFGSSNAHKTLRKMLVEDHKLDGIVSMPSGVFRPYAGVSTAILFFTRTDSGGTDNVWFYDMQADGYSLDDKRTPLDATKHEANNLPDILRRWQSLQPSPDPTGHPLPQAGEGSPSATPATHSPLLPAGEGGQSTAKVIHSPLPPAGEGGQSPAKVIHSPRPLAGEGGQSAAKVIYSPRPLAGEGGPEGRERGGEAARTRTDQSFLVSKAEIAGNDYDLSINRYKQVVYAEVQHESPKKLLAELKALELEILKGMEELEGMLL